MQYAVIEGISFGLLDGVNSILKVNNNFEKIFVVGGGSRSSFWIGLLSSLLNRKLIVCDQSEFGAAIGVSRLAMNVDGNIKKKDKIIKEVKTSKEFNPKFENNKILLRRYEIWRNIYLSNNKIAPSLLT